jgi:uncharacterized damage-inducible protein DinB
MRMLLGIAGLALTLGAVPTATAQSAGSLSADLLRDVAQVEEKLVGLAKAIPADKYEWRPGAKVRSVGELFMHVSADNYLIPAAAGTAAPAATGVKGEDYKTAVAFENRKLSRDATIAELEASFRHLKQAMSAAGDANLGKSIKMFGQDFTMQQVWILATTHLHEHLGQAIAYARSNDVVPPWSR